MRKSHYLIINISFFIIFLQASCIFRAYKEINYFDITASNMKLAEYSPYIDITTVATQGPFRTKMVIRTGKHKVIFDEYNRWAQTPDAMLKRYLKQRFLQHPSDGSPYKISIKILNFEADRFNHCTIFTVQYSIKPPSGKASEFSFSKATKSTDITAEVFSENMSNAFQELAEDIKKKVSESK